MFIMLKFCGIKDDMKKWWKKTENSKADYKVSSTYTVFIFVVALSLIGLTAHAVTLPNNNGSSTSTPPTTGGTSTTAPQGPPMTGGSTSQPSQSTGSNQGQQIEQDDIDYSTGGMKFNPINSRTCKNDTSAEDCWNESGWPSFSSEYSDCRLDSVTTMGKSVSGPKSPIMQDYSSIKFYCKDKDGDAENFWWECNVTTVEAGMYFSCPSKDTRDANRNGLQNNTVKMTDSDFGGYIAANNPGDCSDKWPDYDAESDKCINADGIANATTEEQCTEANGVWSEDENGEGKCYTSDNEASEASASEEDPCDAGFFGFGWILCSGADLLQSIITGFLTWIDGQLNWTFLAQNSQTILPRWQDFLNIANVLFVIAFLVMIYSMATSTGLSNYDVKKMLPRLIVVAIIVNISFYICAALVDLSNIVGSGLYSLIAGDAADKGFKVELDLLESGVVLIVTVIAAFLFIGTGLLAIVVIFLCLYLRQVALIVLTIVSPIALVCYLLPNTEQWAKKWFSWFSRMLLIYPMFAAVWGGSIWLGNTITATNINDNGAIPIPDFVPQMICLIIPALSILPLFKASGGLMGTISNKVAGGAARTGLAGRINKTTGRPAKAIGRGVGRIATNNFVTRGITGAVGSGTGHLASKVSHIPGIGGALSRGLYSTSNKANAHAGYVSAQAKAIDDQAMTQAKSDLSQVSQAELIQIATTGQYKDKAADEHILRAATEMSQDNMDEDDVKKMLVKRAQIAKELADKGRKDEAQRLLDNAANGAKKSGHYAGAGGALDRDFRNGKWGDNAEQAYNDAVAKKMSNMSAEQMAGTSANTLKHMNEAVENASTQMRDDAIRNTRNVNRAVSSAPDLQNKMSSGAIAEMQRSEDLYTSREANARNGIGLGSLQAQLKQATAQQQAAQQTGNQQAYQKAQQTINVVQGQLTNIVGAMRDPKQGNYNGVQFGDLHTKDQQWISRNLSISNPTPPIQGTPPQRP